MLRSRLVALVASFSLLLASCGGGGGNNSTSGGSSSTATPTVPAPTQASLTAADVQQVVAQAVGEAQARGKAANIAVVDRVGNVLAIFKMTGAVNTVTIPPAPSGNNHDFQGVDIVPATSAAVAKAITGAYLSSSGNAFSTRTASEIVQQHFPPAANDANLPSGPLFGVQFSSLPCSDLVARFNAAGGAGALIGPKRSPLGLSADPGGMPLYKNGVVVGGIGIEIDGTYGLDPNVSDVDSSDEEYVALAGLNGFAAPSGITADQILVGGVALRYSDATTSGLRSNPGSAAGFASINGAAGALTALRGYYDGTAVLAGTAYGSEASGVRASTTAEFSNPSAYVLSDGSGNDRFPIRAGTDSATNSQPLTVAEVTAVLEEAFRIMSRARGQIRQPKDSQAQVTLSVVDTNGAILGIVRGPDAPIFGTDVSLQKARTAAFFSNPNAAADLTANPSPDVEAYVTAARTFLSDPTALTGKFAFSDRAGGNLSRPFFPDGEDGQPNGPFSHPIQDFNPFSTGLQSALILANVVQDVAYTAGVSDVDTPARCTQNPDVAPGQNRLQNGIQIFPGSVPIYRGNTVVGGIGISGDGIDQDDMISFLGLYNASQRVKTINEAPAAIRADQLNITPPGTNVATRLRFVSCPFAPFLDTSDQNPCDGK